MGYFASFSAALLAFAIAGCQTPRYREFEQVKVGMTKEQVLSTAGGPSSRDRKQSVDRWTYNLHDHPDGKVVREVHFIEGVSTYVGPKQVPAISADQQDQINEIKNREAEDRDRVDYSSVNKQYEIQRFVPIDSDDEGPVTLEQKSESGTAR